MPSTTYLLVDLHRSFFVTFPEDVFVMSLTMQHAEGVALVSQLAIFLFISLRDPNLTRSTLQHRFGVWVLDTNNKFFTLVKVASKR